MICAHTGCGVAPENSLASSEEGCALGADMVEVDVRVTKDGVAVLMHDDTPLLREYTFEQLNHFDVRSTISETYAQHEITKLQDVLNLVQDNNIWINLDLKHSDSIEPTVKLIQSFPEPQRLVITGCSDQITKWYPEIQVLMNTPDHLSPKEEADYYEFAMKMCLTANREGYYGLNMDFRTCRKEVVQLAHEMNLLVWVYTVNNPEDMKHCVALQVDGITTRKVTKLIDIRNNQETYNNMESLP